MPSEILLIGHNDERLSPYTRIVEEFGFEAQHATSIEDARRAYEDAKPALTVFPLTGKKQVDDVIVTQLHKWGLKDVVFVGGRDDSPQALSDYPPFMRLSDCESFRNRLAQLADTVEHKKTDRHRFGPMLGESEPMMNLYADIARVARSNAPVLVEGESGAGKELVAQAVAQRSTRASHPLVAVNCGAIAPSLVESQLFGHEKGAFTGAHQAYRGVFEQAHRGTLLLDEITEMSPEMQVKLLRVLETKSLQRVGAENETQVDVRIIAATNRPIGKAVADGIFRKDLMYRLAVFPIEVPPLRARGRDVELLANYFLSVFNRSERQQKQFTPAALQYLCEYNWPGNVRELKNVVHRAFIMSDQEISLSLTRRLIQQHPSPGDHVPSDQPSLNVPIGSSLHEVERQVIISTLEHHDGDKRKVADILGISLKTLYNRLNAYKAECVQAPAAS